MLQFLQRASNKTRADFAYAAGLLMGFRGNPRGARVAFHRA
jgi:hypothetical protein